VRPYNQVGQRVCRNAKDPSVGAADCNHRHDRNRAPRLTCEQRVQSPKGVFDDMLPILGDVEVCVRSQLFFWKPFNGVQNLTAAFLLGRAPRRIPGLAVRTVRNRWDTGCS
jgi:hypothetical protein